MDIFDEAFAIDTDTFIKVVLISASSYLWKCTVLEKLSRFKKKSYRFSSREFSLSLTSSCGRYLTLINSCHISSTISIKNGSPEKPH